MAALFGLVRHILEGPLRPIFADVYIELQPTFSIEEEEEPNTKAFPYPLPKDSAQQVLSSIPLFLLYPGFLAAIGGAGFAGSVLGRAAPGEI